MKRIPASIDRASEGWEHLPLVKLGKLLKQMVWFSGDYELNRVRDIFEKTRRLSNIVFPTSASIYIWYREQQITIECIWETRAAPYDTIQEYPDRFAIGIIEPLHNDFQITRYHVADAIKYKHSRYYSATIDKIEDAISNAQEVIDNTIAEEEQERERVIKLELTKKNLCKNLDVVLTSDGNELYYREDDEYCLHFQLLEDGFYEITVIGGQYTEAEIKKMIRIIGGNPRAIAERLSK